MKQILYILILLVVVSFKVPDTNDCILALFKQTDSLDNNIFKQWPSYKDGVRNIQDIDSLSYKIERIFDEKGILLYETISNQYTNIAFIKEYYEIETKSYSVGYKIIHPYNKRIGIWKDFSVDGKLIYSKNYDEGFKISFCEFYEICQSNGISGKDKIIYFIDDSRVWYARKFNHKKNIFGKKVPDTGLTLQVDSMKIEKFKIFDHDRIVYYK